MERCIILLSKNKGVCVCVKKPGRIYTKFLIVIIYGGRSRNFNFWFKYFELFYILGTSM